MRALNHIGLFEGDIGSAAQYPAMVDPSDAQASLESRAKAYLETNCSICHRPGGTARVGIDLRYGTSLADMNLVGVPAARSTTLGAMRVGPGDPEGSDLWRRVAAIDANRMPVLGVSVADEEALRLLTDWIGGMR